MLRVSPEGSKEFTPEQQAAIVKYAAGLMLGWNDEHISNIISPDIGDGFDCVMHDNPNLFPDWEEADAKGEQPLLWSAHEEVVSVLDNFMDDLAKLAGFESLEDARKQTLVNGGTNLTSGKYPVMNVKHG